MSDDSKTIPTAPYASGRTMKPPGLIRRLFVGVVKYVLPLVVVAAGVAGAIKLYRTGPTAQRRQPQRHDWLVQVQPVSLTNEQAMIHAMGTVMPSKQVVLQPRVSGEIVRISPSLVPGGRFEADAFMLQIDPADYELAVHRAESQVAEAEYALKLEKGHQEIAQREWELLDAASEASEADRELALRKPHLARAEAALKAAQAALREAELDLERTTIRAPYACLVMEEDIDLGAQVTTQTPLAKLVGVDEYWVRASVPVDELSWIRFPDADGHGGSPVTVRQQLDDIRSQEWQGRVLRIMGDLEPQGRMARVLISVKDPLGQEASKAPQMPLIVGAYVNVVIEGREIENVYAIPRTVLREGRSVWVMDEGRALDIRDVDIVWQNRSVVLVRSGLEAGDQVVVSDIPAPVQGMGLTLGDVAPESGAPNDHVVLRNGKESGHDTSQ